jgi:hypothetical protein
MSTSDEAVVRLLEELCGVQRELRDAQREHLAWARDSMQRSLQAQQDAIDLARRASRFYRIVVAVAALLVLGLLAFLHHLA